MEIALVGLFGGIVGGLIAGLFQMRVQRMGLLDLRRLDAADGFLSTAREVFTKLPAQAKKKGREGEWLDEMRQGMDKASEDLDAMPRRAGRLALLYGHNTPVALAAEDVVEKISELRDEIRSARNDVGAINDLYESVVNSRDKFIRFASRAVTRPAWQKWWFGS